MKKDSNIIIRIDSKEKIKLLEKCKFLNISISDYTRALYVHGEVRILSSQTERDLHGLAINVNQISKKFNGGSITNNQLLEELKDIINSLKKLKLP